MPAACGAGRFRLTPEQAFILVDRDSPFFLGSLFPMARPYWANIDTLAEAFRHGGGVPQDAYGEDFWCGFEHFTRTGFRNNLVQDWLPAMPAVDAALREIRRALKPGGTYFILEFNFFGDLQRNIDHPMGIGAFGYSASTNYCMTQALSVGGEGTGTCMGEEKARELATEAGFGHFRRIDFPNNPFNLFYELRV